MALSPSPTTALFYDPLFLEHAPGAGSAGAHPECPDRLNWIRDHLNRTGLWGRCRLMDCRDATREEIARVHRPEYIQAVQRACAAGGGWLDADTALSAQSCAAAVRAAGAGLSAVEAVRRGEARNAFCLVRPPGHHAMPGQAMGFCLFNNIAIAARHLRERLGVGRVAVFDWDVHHGNGTQHAFYRDGSVLFASLHLWPHYPGTGASDERGEGPGLGRIINRPLPRGTTGAEYLAVARAIVQGPLADFRPEFILISAGFDAYAGDPLGGLSLEPADFRTLTRLLVSAADDMACGVVSFLEGGYHKEGLPLCAAAHLEGLLGEG